MRQSRHATLACGGDAWPLWAIAGGFPASAGESVEHTRVEDPADGPVYTRAMPEQTLPDAPGRATKVAIVVFEDVQALDVAGPMDVFAEANKFLPADSRYDVALVGMRAGGLRCANGLEIHVGFGYADYDGQPDLMLVAGGPSLPEFQPASGILEWMREKARHSVRFGSVCNGAFPLGHAGLLDGREVTAHWNDVDRLTAQFPRARVRPDKIFVRDDRLFTSAGVAAGIDLCLALVAEDWGHEMALRIAKKLIVYIRRDGGQSQYSPYLSAGPKEETIVAKVLRHVTDHLGEQLSMEQLADAVSVSRRTFSRIFARSANMTPSAFVEQVRVDHSRKLLEETDLPLKTVAFRCGFRNSNQMRFIYSRRLDTTPREYRERFRRQESGSSWPDRAVPSVAAGVQDIRIAPSPQRATAQ